MPLTVNALMGREASLNPQWRSQLAVQPVPRPFCVGGKSSTSANYSGCESSVRRRYRCEVQRGADSRCEYRKRERKHAREVVDSRPGAWVAQQFIVICRHHLQIYPPRTNVPLNPPPTYPPDLVPRGQPNPLQENPTSFSGYATPEEQRLLTARGDGHNV